jgi:inorganic pyrophosphatase
VTLGIAIHLPLVLNVDNAVQIIAVHADDPAYKNIKDISELPAHRLNEIRRFFEDYKKNENKEVVVDEILGADAARQAILDAQALYKAEYLPKQQR